MIPHAWFRSFLGFALIAIACGSTGGIATPLDSVLERDVDDALLDELDDEIERQVGDRLDATLDAVDRATTDALGRVEEILPAADEKFFAALDPEGFAMEQAVWVILATPGELDRIERLGLAVRERRRLDAVGLVLLRVEAPRDRALADTVRELAPAAEVDFNHVYRPEAGVPPAKQGPPARRRASASASIAIGILDSAVSAGHVSLRRAEIVQEDFVPFARRRPTDHGTAVAAILSGLLPGGRLYAASVFFEDDAGASAATTASLVQALDWVVASGARVVNLSLAGPPNRVLEASIERVAARGVVVVAAVGNAGPAAGPQYPAAYETVVGVTAVDPLDRVYRYANRGRQVTFAAPGVDVVVARGDGSYGRESGTSMAAPHAAALIARALAGSRERPDRVLTTLKRTAVDLGEPGFDSIFGFGRIAE